jgi:hypothetical protein
MLATVQPQQTRLLLQLLPLAVLLLAVTACRAMLDWVTALVLRAQARVLTHLLHLQPAAMVTHSVQDMVRTL